MKKGLVLVMLGLLVLAAAALSVTAVAVGKEITMSHCQGDSSWPQWEAFVGEYEKLSGNHVKLIYVPAGTYNDWLKAQFAAGTEPDVIMTAQSFGDWLKNGWIVDHSKYLAQISPYTKKTWSDSFLPGILSQVRDPNMGQAQLGIPFAQIMVNLYVNADMMGKIGVTAVPRTWSELLAAAKKAQESGTIGFSVQNSIDWNLSWLTQFVAEDLFHDLIPKFDVVTKNGKIDQAEWALAFLNGKIKPNDPRIKDLLRSLKDLAQYFNPGFNAASWEFEGLFNNGKSFMTVNGSWYPNQHLSGKYPINYVSGGVPYIDKRYSKYGALKPHKWLGGTSALAIVTRNAVKNGKENEAVDFLRFWTDPKTGAKSLTEKLMFIPVVKGVSTPKAMEGIVQSMGGDEQLVNFSNVKLMTGEVTERWFKDMQLYLDNKMSMDGFLADFADAIARGAEQANRLHPEWGLDKFLK